MTETKKVELTVGDCEVDLVLRRATIGDDMRKSMLAAAAMEKPLADKSDQVVALVVYPRCMACLVEGKIDGKDARSLSLEEFLGLPYQVGDAWIDGAIELNPGWRLGGTEQVEDEEAKKKG